jgi:glycosyltransferase involved in cell wall biosynthesis
MEPNQGGSGAIRVLRLFSRLNIGGPSIHVILLTAGLTAKGYTTRLVVGTEAAHEGNLLDLADAKGVACESLASLGREIRPFQDLRALVRLYRLMRAYRPQIVHTHAAKAGLLGRLAARLAGVPVVVHTYHGHVLRGYFSPLKTRVFLQLERLLGRATDVLIAVSPRVKQDLVELGVASADRFRVVALGLELDGLAGSLPRGGLRQERAIPHDVPLVGMVGRLVPIKDVPTFLLAAAKVRQITPAARFALVGDGEERVLLEEQCARLGMAEAVTFHGWRRDMKAVYGDLDVVVNSSRNEGTPVALIEALAAARPVVATHVGGTPDLLRGGEFGRLVAAGDASALAQAILDTLADREAAAQRARAGQAHVLREHSASRLIADIDGLYRDLLAEKTAA